tara:strand:+ start:1635 stop:2210 length:576 start_codon:yes stop_codon:yes gene_type:complete
MSELRTNKIIPRDGLPSETSGDLKGGGIIQIVTKFKKDAQIISGSGNVTQNQEYPITGLSVVIKPSRSSNLVWVQGFVSHNCNDNQQASFYVSRNGTNVSPIGDAGSGNQKRVFVSAQGNQDYMGNWVVKNTPFWFMDNPATTSAVTYQVGAIMGVTNSKYLWINRSERDSSGTGYDFRAVSNITAWEVSG